MKIQTILHVLRTILLVQIEETVLDWNQQHKQLWWWKPKTSWKWKFAHKNFDN